MKWIRWVVPCILGVSIAFAQSGEDLAAKGQAAYDRKEYAASAQLFLDAFKKAPDNNSLYNAACSLALDGQTDRAFDVLQQLAKRGYNNAPHMKQDADFNSIRSDPRWAQVMAKVEANALKNPPPKPFEKPYKILGLLATHDALVNQLGEDNTKIVQEGKVLTFLHRSKAKTVRLNGGIQEAMIRVRDSDVWVLQLEMNGWQRVIDSYGFSEDGSYGPLEVWRGMFAPPEPAKSKPLKGTIIKRIVHSNSLGEDRPIIVYLPPDAPKAGLPAVFLADGGACESFAEVLEPLILAHKVRPCAIVGIPPGPYEGKAGEPYDMMKDLRAREYLVQADPERFNKHLQFFTEEVGAYVRQEFGITSEREDRAVTGFSNGGAFSAAAAVKKPGFFGVSMPLSLGVPPVDPKPKQPMPRMYMAGGSLESFGLSTQRFYEKMKGWGVDCTFKMYAAGHDPEMWRAAFAEMMPKVFPVSQ